MRRTPLRLCVLSGLLIPAWPALFMLLRPRGEHSVNSVSDKSEEKTVPMKKVVILGIGNILLKDEGIGIHLVNALQDSLSPPNIHLEVIDGGTSPEVFYQLGEMDKLIIIDAARGGGDP